MRIGVGLAIVGLWAGTALAGELGPCGNEQLGPRAECGTIRVAEDRGDTDGRTIDLNVVVLRAADRSDRAPLFALAGGPGQGATDLAGLALGPWAPVNEVRDIVLVDQRGTGRSNKIDCSADAAGDPSSVFGGLFKPAQMRSCLQEISSHADPRLYGSLEVVADLEEVREALGYEKAVLWGGSGGTRTALVWMKEHPDSVEAVALDGVTPTSFRSPTSFAPAAQAALERVFIDCAAQESCAEAYPDLAQAFDELIGTFADGPVTTFVTREDGERVPVEMHLGDFVYAVRGLLYNSRRIAELPRMIHEAAASGDPSEFAQGYWFRQIALGPAVAFGVHFGIVCSEDMPYIDPVGVPAQTEATFLGTYLIEQYGGICDFWPRREMPADWLEPTVSDIPTLLISGYYDPSTPASSADEVAEHLSQSRHVVVRNESHGAEFGCARQAMVDFLRSGSLEGLGPVCEQVGSVEFAVP